MVKSIQKKQKKHLKDLKKRKLHRAKVKFEIKKIRPDTFEMAEQKYHAAMDRETKRPVRRKLVERGGKVKTFLKKLFNRKAT